MQIPILSGIYTSTSPDFRISYPINLVPIPMDTGLSQGYLRPSDGLVKFATGPGKDRGGINWDNKCYRVMGTKLVVVNEDGSVVTLGDVGPGVPVTMDYSFTDLALASGGTLYYYNSNDGIDPLPGDQAVGPVIDFVWIDGYYAFTDGEFIRVTELNNKFIVNPLKYASSEVDPDPIVALKKLRNELYAINRYTIEVFRNIGGSGFPFQRINGAQIQKGAVGTRAVCVFAETIAFIGGGRNETVGIYLGLNSNTTKISTKEIDFILAEFTEEELSQTVIEERLYRNNHNLYVHLPNQTLVYDLSSSQLVGQPVWYILTSSLAGLSEYRARDFVWCYNQWLAGDPSTENVVVTDDNISSQFGEPVGWQFQTPILYGEGRSVIVYDLELVAITGSVEIGKDPTISTSWSTDGRSFSQRKYIRVGSTGHTRKRLKWFGQGSFRNWRIQRFQGDSQAHLAFARLEATVEPLAY